MMEVQKMVIYKAVNTINDMVYIGATTRNLEDRIADHTQKANDHSGHFFQEAIGTYGPEAFTWEQIDTASSTDELAAKEIKYILAYNSNHTGYNSDKGGGFKKTVYQYNLDGILSNSYPDLASAASAINANKKSISKACWSVNQTFGGFFWSYEYHESFISKHDNRKKTVMQFDLDGNFLARFNSASEASKTTGILKDCITKCCRGERRSSGGYVWTYI